MCHDLLDEDVVVVKKISEGSGFAW